MVAILLLVALVLLTVFAAVVNNVGRRRDYRIYRKIAAEFGMHYSPGDPLRVTPRVAGHLPIPGAAAVLVMDLMYRTDSEPAGSHHYIFTAEYTLGTIDVRRRIRRVARWSEPKAAVDSTLVEPVLIADGSVPIADQYRRLLKSSGPIAPGS